MIVQKPYGNNNSSSYGNMQEKFENSHRVIFAHLLFKKKCSVLKFFGLIYTITVRKKNY